MPPRVVLVSVPSFMMMFVLAGCAAQQMVGDRQLSNNPTFQSDSSEDQCSKPTQEHSYLEPCIALGGRGPHIPIRDVPSSVHIINRDLLDDQKVLRIEDALRNVSGVH